MPKKQDEQEGQAEQGQELLAPPQKQKPVTYAEAGIDGPPDALVTWVIEPPAPIAYYYLPDENPQGARFQGIPLRNLTVVEVAKLPEWKQRQIKKSKMYSDSPPGKGKE